MSLKKDIAYGFPTFGYCVKCKKEIRMLDMKNVTLMNGRPAVKCKCPLCGTWVFRISRDKI